VGIGADLRKGFTYPALTFEIKTAIFSDERSEASPTYFFLASTR
jgi:hypothetical protein